MLSLLEMRQIDASLPASTKRRYKLVRSDDLSDIQGEIEWADVETGKFCVLEPKMEGGFYVVGTDGKRVIERREHEWQPYSFTIAWR